MSEEWHWSGDIKVSVDGSGGLTVRVPPEARVGGEVIREIGALRENIASLEELVERLLTCLKPVMRRGENNLKDLYAGDLSTDLEQMVREQRDRILMLNQTISYILEALEL
jgi:Mg2+ and Co2+ transporter CorA